jgi:hypothetical protein
VRSQKLEVKYRSQKFEAAGLQFEVAAGFSPADDSEKFEVVTPCAMTVND